MEIVEARAEDKAAWLPLWQGYLRFYEHVLPEAVTNLTFARCLSPEEPVFLRLAKEDGEVLGFATYILHRSTWVETYYCYLEDLFVAENARGKGVGRTLIEAVAAEAKAVGAGRLYWMTQNSNRTAQALYDKVAQKRDFVEYLKPL